MSALSGFTAALPASGLAAHRNPKAGGASCFAGKYPLVWLRNFRGGLCAVEPAEVQLTGHNGRHPYKRNKKTSPPDDVFGNDAHTAHILDHVETRGRLLGDVEIHTLPIGAHDETEEFGRQLDSTLGYAEVLAYVSL